MAARHSSGVAEVQGTAADAIRCKRSLVKRGYLPEFSGSSEDDRAQSPLTNRFYHARVRVLLQLLKNGVEAQQVSQVLVIGAGLDTFVEQAVHAINPAELPVYAVDYATVLAERPITSRSIPVACDVAKQDDLERALLAREFAFSAKTLIVIECVLMYMEASAVAGLMRWITTRMQHATMISFEPVGFGHGFGKVLSSKFAAAVAAATRSDQVHSTSDASQHLLDNGWQHVQVLPVRDAVCLYVCEDELRRVSQLEPFDEHAALHALLLCYAVSVASTNAGMFAAVANQHMPASDTTNMLQQQRQVRLALLCSRVTRLEHRFSTSNRHVLIRALNEADDVEALHILFKQTHSPHMHITSVDRYVRHVLRDDLKNPFRYYGGAGGRQMLVAFEKGRLAGMVAVAAASEEIAEDSSVQVTIELKRLCVDESHRSKGIGRRLVTSALELCRRNYQHVQQIHVMATTLELLRQAQTLYESEGFMQSKRESIDAQGDCVLLTYSKQLLNVP